MKGFVYTKMERIWCQNGLFTSDLKDFNFNPVSFCVELMGTFPKSTIGFQYFIHIEVQPNARMLFFLWFSQVGCPRFGWINSPMDVQKLNSICSLENQFFFDPTRWWWPKVTPFLAYSSKLGKTWITSQVTLRKLIPDKWRNEISPSTSLKWNVIWHKHKAQKEAAFFWLVFHKALAVNEWAWENLKRGLTKVVYFVVQEPWNW